MTCFHNNGASIIAPFRAYHAQNFEEVTLPSIQQDPVVLQRNEPWINLHDKFDGTRSKFWGFVNQLRLITVLQLERYPTEETHDGLVGTLQTWQTLLWFAPLFQKRSPILSNFKTFLEAFLETLGKHDRIRWATTKIRSLRYLRTHEGDPEMKNHLQYDRDGGYQVIV